jgi:hypothetical protein
VHARKGADDARQRWAAPLSRSTQACPRSHQYWSRRRAALPSALLLVDVSGRLALDLRDDRNQAKGIAAVGSAVVRGDVAVSTPRRACCDDDDVDRQRHLERVARALGVEGGVFARLAELQSADLRAVLLDVAARRAAERRPADVLAQYERDRTLRPSTLAPAVYRAFESRAMEALPPGFIELSLAPHAPLGTSSVLGRLSQDRVLTTITDSEVLSDSTNVLALECALRRRDTISRRATETRLAAAHRLVRPRDQAHFGLIGLCTAGRDRGSFALQLNALREHLDWHLGVISREAPFLDLEVLITDLSGGLHRSALDQRLLQPLHAAWPAARVRFHDDRQAGRAYYTTACFGVHALHPDGSRSNLSDGGFVDWTAQLLADSKERLLISGLGSERLVHLRAAQ